MSKVINLEGSPKEFVIRSLTAPRESQPMRYPVILQKTGHIPVMGYVVTFLTLRDWCDMNGYSIVELRAGSRPAFKEERTDLF